jgi:hypothetical protein
MRQRWLVLWLASAVAVTSVPLAWAHHGWSGYDADKPMTLTGIIRESGYEHPHGHALRVGTTATVMGYPSRNDPGELRAERITIEGKTVELR